LWRKEKFMGLELIEISKEEVVDARVEEVERELEVLLLAMIEIDRGI